MVHVLRVVLPDSPVHQGSQPSHGALRDVRFLGSHADGEELKAAAGVLWDQCDDRRVLRLPSSCARPGFAQCCCFCLLLFCVLPLLCVDAEEAVGFVKECFCCLFETVLGMHPVIQGNRNDGCAPHKGFLSFTPPIPTVRVHDPASAILKHKIPGNDVRSPKCL